MLSGFNLHRSTKLVIKFITSVKLVWIPDADGSFSCSPDFVFIQLHRKATNAVSHYVYRACYCISYSSSEAPFTSAFFNLYLRGTIRRAESTRLPYYSRLYCCRLCARCDEQLLGAVHPRSASRARQRPPACTGLCWKLPS